MHLGKKLFDFSLIDDQKYILDEIVKIAKDVNSDGVIIAGDIYDRNVPPAEAVEIFDDFLTKLSTSKIPVYIISGNHDSAERLSFGARIFKDENIYISGVFNGKPEKITKQDKWGNVNIYLMPFVKPSNVRVFFEDEKIESYDDAIKTIIKHTEINTDQRNIIVSHQFITGAQTCESEEINIGGLDNIDVSAFDKFDYCALGHIHGSQKISRDTVRYCGTPLKYSFSEVHHKKSVTIVELKEKGNVDLEFVPLIPKRNLQEIKGLYNDLTDKEFYSSLNLDDYYHITLTNEDDIPYVIEKLRTIYPNIMKLDYDNKRTQEMYSNILGERAKEKTPTELFSQLYKAQNNSDMNEIQEEYVNRLIDKIWSENN